MLVNKSETFNCDYKYSASEDKRFSEVKVWVAHVGWNYNGTYFSKELLEEMANESLAEIPIVGFLEYDEDGDKDFAGHEETFVVDNGEVKLKYLGVPYGFVPSTPEWQFEELETEKGTLEYLTVKAKVWNKFDGSELFSEDKGHSMELVSDTLEGVKASELPDSHEAGGQGIDGWFITNAQFEALCVLGDNHSPAMAGSMIEKFSHRFTEESSFKAKFKEMLSEYTSEEGGEKVDKDEKYELTLQQKQMMLSEKVEMLEMISDEDWEYPRYSFVDADEDYVYAYDYKEYKSVGFPYSIEDKEIVLNSEEMFEAISAMMPKSDAFEDKEDVITKLIESQKDKFDKKLDNELGDLAQKHEVELEDVKSNHEKVIDGLNGNIESKCSKIEELEKFKNNVIKERKIEYINSIDNLDEVDKEKLIETVDNYDTDSLKSKVAQVIGEKTIKFSKKVEPIKDVFDTSNDDGDKELSDLDKLIKKYSKKNEEE